MRIIFLSLLLCFVAMPAWACRCLAPSDDHAMMSYQEADVVVKATITSASEGFSNLGPILKMDVIDVIKGEDIPESITANYNNVTAACGNEFTVEQDYIVALYDTRSLILADSNPRGYGFRVMVSCHQNQIRYYLKNKDITKREESK